MITEHKYYKTVTQLNSLGLHIKHSLLFELIFQGVDTHALMHLKTLNVSHNMLCSITDIALFILEINGAQ